MIGDCMDEQWHPDMYPEFAPEGIQVGCDHTATVLVERDGEREVVCQLHATARLAEALDAGAAMKLRTIDDTDREHLASGAAYADALELDREQYIWLAHEGLDGNVHVSTPEHSPECFDVGFEWRLMERVAAWDAEESRSMARAYEPPLDPPSHYRDVL